MLTAASPPRPRRGWLSLTAVLIVGALVAAALPAGVFAWRSMSLDLEERRERGADDQLVLAQTLAVAFDQLLRSHLAAVVVLARQAEAGPLDPSRLDRLLQTVLAAHPVFDTILVVDRTGTGTAFQPPDKAPDGGALGVAFADRAWFRQMDHLRQPIVDPTALAEGVTGRPTVALRAPVLGPTGELRGVVAASLDLREVAAIARRVTLGRTGQVSVVATDRLVLIPPGAPSAAGPVRAAETLWARVSGRDSGLLPSFHDGREERIGAFATVPVSQWKVVASQAAGELEAEAWKGARASLSWVALAFVLAVGPMVVVAVLIARPIRAVADAAQRLATGDLTTRTRRAGGLAELATLVGAFDTMAHALETNEARLRDAEVERRTAEARLRLAAIVESSDDAVIAENLDGVITSWNRSAERIYGYAAGEAVGRPVSILNPPGTPASGHLLSRVARGEPVRQEQRVHLRRDGTPIDVSLTVSPIRDTAGHLTGLSTITRDVTDLKRRARELDRANRALRITGSCSEALVRARQESDLLREVCRVVAEVGDYPLAWVGYAEPDPARTVRPVARAGPEAPVERVPATWGDDPNGRGPIGTAIRTAAPVLVSDVASDPRFEPWRESALASGLAAVVALPLRSGSSVFGILVVYATRTGAFDAAETDLLTRVADSLAYGILALRADAERQLADQSRQRALADLTARVRELTVLRDTARVLNREDTSEGDLLGRVVALLPAASPHPDRTGARITVGDLVAATPGFTALPGLARTEWRLADGRAGIVEIAGPASESVDAPGPLFPGDHGFLDTLADLLRSHLDRRGAEEARRRADILFRALVENAEDAITVLDAQGVIRYQSPSVQRLLGYRPEELVGQSAFQHLHPDDDRAVVNLFTRGLEEPGFTAAIEYRLRHRDGSWRAFHGIAKNLLHDPVVAGVVVNSRDVAGRRPAERPGTPAAPAGSPAGGGETE